MNKLLNITPSPGPTPTPPSQDVPNHNGPNIGMNTGSANINGPKVNIIPGLVSLNTFNFPVSFNFSSGDTANKEIDYEKKTITYKYGSDIISSDDLKNIVYNSGSVSQVANNFNRLGVKGKKASFGVNASVSMVGYIETSYASGIEQPIEGGFIVLADGSSSLKFPVYGPIYVKLGLSVSSTGKIALNIQDTNITDPAILSDLLLSVGISVGGGAGCDWLYAEVGVEGVLDNNLSYNSKTFTSLSESYKANITGSLYAKAALFNNETPPFKYKFASFKLWPKSDSLPNARIQRVGIASKNSADSYFEPINRDYLSEVHEDNIARTMEVNDSGYEINNVFPMGDPQMVTLNDGRVIAIWIADNGQQNTNGYSTLVYSIRNAQGSWSTPAEVSHSEFADYYPDITSDGQNVYVVWLRANKTFEEDVPISSIMGNISLMSSTFNGTNFNEPIVITSPSNTPMMPKVDIGQNGQVNIVWVQNSENDYLLQSGSNTIYTSTLNASPSVLAQNVGLITSLASDDSRAYYVIDEDGSLEEDTESTLFSVANGQAPTQINSGNIINTMVRNYDDNIYFIAGESELMMLNDNGSVVDTGTQVASDYKVLNNNGQLTVLSNESTGYSSQIYKTEGIPGGQWSYSVPNTKFNQKISSFDSVIDPISNEPLVSLNAKTVDDSYQGEENQTPYGNTDLVIQDLQNQWNLSVEPYLYYDPGFVAGGSEVTFTAEVTNNSTQEVTSLDVALTDQNGNSLGIQTINQSIPVGDTSSVEFAVQLPSNLNNFTLNATFNPSGQQVSDANTNVAYADLDQSYYSESNSAISVDPSTVNLTTVEGGLNSATVTANLLSSPQDSDLTWTVRDSSVAAVEPGPNNTATITAVSPGTTSVTVMEPGGDTAEVTVFVNDGSVICDGLQISSITPDTYTITALNVRPNPALDSAEPVQKVSMFTWSDSQQTDLDCKIAVQNGSDWSYTFPVNDTPRNNYYLNGDQIKINVYGSADPNTEGNLISIYYQYRWVNNANSSGHNVAYIAYGQDIGFIKPTVFDGAMAGTEGQSRHLEGLRVSSNVPGVSINTSVHAENIGWMAPVSDGTYAGTMWQNRKIEAARLTLSGVNASKYYLQYRAHCQNVGWTDWVSTDQVDQNTAFAGTVGQNLQMEAIEIKLLPR